MRLDWVRSLREQCETGTRCPCMDSGPVYSNSGNPDHDGAPDECPDCWQGSRPVPFLFKQWGAHDEAGKRVGKKAAGRVLDGRTHDAFPPEGGDRTAVAVEVTR